MSILLRALALFQALTFAVAVTIDSCALLQSNIGIGVASAWKENIEGSEVYKPAGNLLLQTQKTVEQETSIMMFAVRTLKSAWPTEIESYLTSHVRKCEEDLAVQLAVFGHAIQAETRENITVLTAALKHMWSKYKDQKHSLENEVQPVGGPENATDPRAAYIELFTQANNHTRTKGLEQNQTALNIVEEMETSLGRAFNETMDKLHDHKQRRINTQCIEMAETMAFSSLVLYEALKNTTLAVSREILRFNTQLLSIGRLAYEPTETSLTENLHAMHAALDDEVDKHVPAMIAAFEMVLPEPKMEREEDQIDDEDSDEEEDEDEDADE